MPVTARQLNRTTLARQMLLRRERTGVVEVVRRVLALQAQEPPSPYLALWNRIAGFDPVEVDEAFAGAGLVKASLMRITLHAVAGEDYSILHEAMLPNLRAARLNDRRFTSTGLSIPEVDAVIPGLVAFAAEARTRSDIEAMLAENLGSPLDCHVWWALRTFAPLVHAPTGGPWSFGRHPSHVAAPDGPRPAPEEALQALIRRYLEAFGPASAADFAQFAMQRQSEIRPALEATGDTVRTVQGPDGTTLLDVSGTPIADEDAAAPPRLLGMWDNVLLAYKDRARVIPDEYRPWVIRRNGDVLPTLLVDGYVAGVWRPVAGGIEATAFRSLPDAAWEGLAAEAASLLAILDDRDPGVYGRYRNWWERLPEGKVRVLGG